MFGVRTSVLVHANTVKYSCKLYYSVRTRVRTKSVRFPKFLWSEQITRLVFIISLRVICRASSTDRYWNKVVCEFVFSID